jgi:hypothetical protein
VAPPVAPRASGEPAPDLAPPEAAAQEPKWYDRLHFGAFVDAYASINYRFPRPQTGTNLYRPYDPNNGVSLSWFGFDAAMDPEPVGFVAQLRFGPSVPYLALGDFNIPGGIGFMQNLYGVWRPGGKDGRVSFIIGKFDTLYGAEVAQSQLNINYTRGALYNLAQPFFHTGVRADINVADPLTLKLMVVNGWNNTIDNNLGKSVGAQLAFAPSDKASFSIGYLGGPEQSDTTTLTCPAGFDFDAGTKSCSIANPDSAGGSGTVSVSGANRLLRHLGDVVIDLKPVENFRLLANATAVFDRLAVAGGGRQNVSWYGASLAARYGLSEHVGVGARGEIVRDKNGQITLPNTEDLTLLTGTLTFEVAPTKNLLLRLDNRVDSANRAVFPRRISDTEKTQFTTTLGVVAMTN